MEGPELEAPVRSAVPVADLGAVDAALAAGGEDALREALRKVRPADLGRDLSRRSIDEGRRILAASEDRAAAATLRAAHPAVERVWDGGENDAGAAGRRARAIAAWEPGRVVELWQRALAGHDGRNRSPFFR